MGSTRPGIYGGAARVIVAARQCPGFVTDERSVGISNLNLEYKTRYGLDFPAGVADPFIELTIAKKYREEPFKFGDIDPPYEHMWRAIRTLLPESFCKRHRWSEMMVRAWCCSDFTVWLGASSCGKSHLAGLLALLDFVTDPDRTYIALASTTVPMLRLRSFSSCIETLRLLKMHPSFSIPLKEAPSQTAILNSVEDGANEASLKYSLRGVAVGDGNEAKAVARLAGVHPADGYCSVILDEASGMPEAAAKARINASAGTRRFRFVALANPISRNDEATRFCEPIDGWGSVDVDTEEWDSTFGKILHFNALNSPAMQEPDGEKKYPFLLSRSQMDTIIREAGGNMEDPMVARMILGYPLESGTALTVLTEADIHNFDLSSPAILDMRGQEVIRIGSCDPAFTSTGDGCAFRWAECCYDTAGKYVLNLKKVELLPIKSGSTEPAAYQVVRQLIQKCQELNIPINHLVIDDSGTQSIAAIVFRESGHMPISCNFAARADDPTKHRNLVTQIWFDIQALARNYQLRGLDTKTALQFCTRRFKNAQRPLALEGKEIFAARNGGQRSPDEADATAMLTLAARRVAGLYPGMTRQGTIDNGFQNTYTQQIETTYDFSVDNSLSSAYSDALY